MSRRPAWVVASVGFGLGVAAILSGGGLPTATGQPKPLVVPPAPQAPTLTTPATLGMKRGGAVELVLSGTNLDAPLGVSLGCPGKATVLPAAKPDPEPSPDKPTTRPTTGRPSAPTLSAGTW